MNKFFEFHSNYDTFSLVLCALCIRVEARIFAEFRRSKFMTTWYCVYAHIAKRINLHTHLSAIAPLTIVVAVVANDSWNKNAAILFVKKEKGEEDEGIVLIFAIPM